MKKNKGTTTQQPTTSTTSSTTSSTITSTTWSSTTTTATTTTSSTTSTTFTTTTKPPSCEVPAGEGQCVDISDYCNFKTVETSDGNNADSKAKVVCRQHYRLNLEYPKDPYIYGKESTYAYCICKDGMCSWRFNKGNVQCTFCPKETLQARNGKKQKFIEWDTGIAIYYPIMVDIRYVFTFL